MLEKRLGVSSLFEFELKESCPVFDVLYPLTVCLLYTLVAGLFYKSHVYWRARITDDDPYFAGMDGHVPVWDTPAARSNSRFHCFLGTAYMAACFFVFFLCMLSWATLFGLLLAASVLSGCLYCLSI